MATAGQNGGGWWEVQTRQNMVLPTEYFSHPCFRIELSLLTSQEVVWTGALQ